MRERVCSRRDQATCEAEPPCIRVRTSEYTPTTICAFLSQAALVGAGDRSLTEPSEPATIGSKLNKRSSQSLLAEGWTDQGYLDSAGLVYNRAETAGVMTDDRQTCHESLHDNGRGCVLDT